MVHLHHDRGELARPVRRANGSVVFEGRIARVGPMAYGDQVEDRDLEGLRQIERTAPGKPVTLDHPSGMVRDGAPARVIGAIEAARIELGHVVATIRIDDPRALRQVEGGLVELSIGYEAEIDAKGYQRDIVVDHLAVVSTARCGPSCRLRADQDGGDVMRVYRTESECSCGPGRADGALDEALDEEASERRYRRRRAVEHARTMGLDPDEAGRRHDVDEAYRSQAQADARKRVALEALRRDSGPLPDEAAAEARMKERSAKAWLLSSDQRGGR